MATERFRLDEFDGERLDIALAERFEALSRSRIAQAIKAGQVRVNDERVKASYVIKVGDEIAMALDTFEPAPIEPEAIPLAVLYEDDHLAVINKPYAMIVHPTASVRSGTLVNALMSRFDQLSDINGGLRPGIVHRLDADTTGAIIVAKTNAAHERLIEAFKRHAVVKRYLAVVEGNWPVTAYVFSGAIGRDPNHRKRMAVIPTGKPALSRFTAISAGERHTLLDVEIVSGRTHQIRVHLKALKHPVVGDRLYGYSRPTIRVAHQLLHAHRLEFEHPITGEAVSLVAPPDACFSDALRRLELMPERGIDQR